MLPEGSLLRMIPNLPSLIQEHFGYRSDKTVEAVLKEQRVTSINQLREKIKQEKKCLLGFSLFYCLRKHPQSDAPRINFLTISVV